MSTQNPHKPIGKTSVNLFAPATCICAIITLLCATTNQSEAKQASNQKGKRVFQQYCSSCHVAGGNIIKPSKAISTSNKLGTLALFQAYLNSPNGHMPHYENLCKDKKMLQSLYQYVRTLESINLKQANASLD